MITLEKIADVLRNYKKEHAISDVKVTADGCVCSQIKNHVNPNRSYTMTVQPIVDKQILKICIPEIAEVRSDGMATELLFMSNACLACGCVGMDSHRGLTFHVSYVCRGDDNNDPPPEVIEKLLDGTMDGLREIEMTALFFSMLDAGIPRNCADNILDILFPEDENNEPDKNEPCESSTSVGSTNQDRSKTVENRRT